MDALAGAVTSGQYLRGNGTDVVMAAIQAADVPTLNQNTTGTATNATNINIINDTASTGFFYPMLSFGISGQNAPRVTGTRLNFVPSSGNLTVGGNVTAFSDEKLKTDWDTLPENFVEDLANVKSGTYTRIDTNERQAGASAQSWQKLLPEVVGANEQGDLTLAYGNAALVSAIELAKRVVSQDAKIASLEDRIANLESVLNKLLEK
jgi:hypothetical protein